MARSNEDAFSEERERNCRETGGWTIATLREDLLTLIKANDRRYTERFTALENSTSAAIDSQKEQVSTAMTAADRALTKAEAASEKRFDAVNEFRATLADQQRTLMPRSETEALIKVMDARIETLNTAVTERMGQGKGALAGWALAIAAISTVVAIVLALVAVFRH